MFTATLPLTLSVVLWLLGVTAHNSMEVSEVAGKWSGLVETLCGTPAERVPGLVADHFGFENSPSGFEAFVEERLGQLTFRPELKTKWTLAIVLNLAQQMDTCMSNELTRLVDSTDTELTAEMAEAFVKDTFKPALEAFST